MGGPGFFERVYVISGGDVGSEQGEYHRPNSDLGCGSFRHAAAMRTADGCRVDLAVMADLLEHRVQVIAEGDEGSEGQVGTPLGAEMVDHFGEPYALGVGVGHV
jgi:hypothetical protein